MGHLQYGALEGVWGPLDSRKYIAFYGYLKYNKEGLYLNYIRQAAQCETYLTYTTFRQLYLFLPSTELSSYCELLYIVGASSIIHNYSNPVTNNQLTIFFYDVSRLYSIY
jgi:hypothetical protein